MLIGALAYNAARRGEPTIILDPSGPLAKLCELPELRPYSRGAGPDRFVRPAPCRPTS